MNIKREFYFGNLMKVFVYLKCESDWNEIGIELKLLKGMFF